MNIKQTLIIIFFMMFLVNFIPRANASLVELEFSNGATVSFDDTINNSYTTSPGSIYESQVRQHDTVRAIVSYSGNVITQAQRSGVYSREAIGVSSGSHFSAYSNYSSVRGNNRFNRIETLSTFNPIGPDIVLSLVDMFDAGTTFKLFGQHVIGGTVHLREEDTMTLTNVFVDGVSQTSPVPVPGAVWLFGTAIAGLIARKKIGGAQ